MTIATITHSFLFRPVSGTLAVLMLILCSSSALPQDSADIFDRWDEVGLLRARGEYAEATSMLEEIIAGYPDDAVQRRAWNLLVHTKFKSGDEESAMRAAREALELYPDLTVNTSMLPSWMNDTYDELRNSMFGSLNVTGPEGADLYLEGDTLGTAPLSITYLRTGMYSLQAFKSGYTEVTDTIRIDPSETLTMSFAMDRNRDRSWWLHRVGAVVLFGTATAMIIAAQTGGGEPEAQPLAGPPPPP
jgi:tetratricopeptide (TPR) repeat protein